MYILISFTFMKMSNRPVAANNDNYKANPIPLNRRPIITPYIRNQDNRYIKPHNTQPTKQTGNKYTNNLPPRKVENGVIHKIIAGKDHNNPNNEQYEYSSEDDNGNNGHDQYYEHFSDDEKEEDEKHDNYHHDQDLEKSPDIHDQHHEKLNQPKKYRNHSKNIKHKNKKNIKGDGSNMVVEIKNLDEYETFKKKYNRSVVFYGATWCHACTEIENLYARIANRYHKRVALAHVDIDVADLSFTAVPVFVALRHGKQINSMEGADKTGLKELIKEAILAK